MEGRTQASRSMSIEPHSIPQFGNPGGQGGGTYTGTSSAPMIASWANIFGPAGNDVREDQLRQKRHQRLHLPDVLKGHNQYLTDRIDGLITDATNSPFTSIILPYKYIEKPDQKMRWNVYSFDEGLASRVPYESAARVLTQTKRSYQAFAVRHGLAIEMEHMFLMSPEGLNNFQNQVKQLVGSIQKSNDLDVHIALVQCSSYAKEYMEKYSSIDKTPAQVCREYIDIFGMVQKNPIALDILIEDAKRQLRLWGSPDPTFLLCNSRLTFQITMTPERTNYITQGIDGIKRLRNGPDLQQYRNLAIIHSRAYEMETGQMPRDVLRRRVRVAEYYRIPPQRNRDWEVELYDESRDTWFKLTPQDLDRYADLSGSSIGAINRGGAVPAGTEHVDSWVDFVTNGGFGQNMPYILTMDRITQPDGTTTTMPKSMCHTMDLAWGASLQHITTANNNLFQTTHTRVHFHTICGLLQEQHMFYPQPNHNMNMDLFPADIQQVPFWLFMNAAFLDNVCSFLWTPIDIPNREMIRNMVIPFTVSGMIDTVNVIADYDNIADNARMNIYHTPMFLATALRYHPDDQVRFELDARFRAARINMQNLRSALSHFVRRCLDDTNIQPIPQNRIQLGRRLEDVFRGRFPRAEESRAVYDRWPNDPYGGQVPVALAAGISETHGTLDDYAIEQFYQTHQGTYTWNSFGSPIIPAMVADFVFDESVILSSFLYAGMRRMMNRAGAPDLDVTPPDFWPRLSESRRDEEVEYVIIRPVVEHNMLGVIIGRGGGTDGSSDEGLGNVVWGNTELSCYDDSFHGVWGMSYKYHSRALIFNNKNLIRLFDVAYDGYNGGKDDRPVNWVDEAPGNSRPFNSCVGDLSVPYNGPSMMVMKFSVNTNSQSYSRNWPSPIMFHDKLEPDCPRMGVDPDSIYSVSEPSWRVFNSPDYREQYRSYLARMPDFSYYHQTRKLPGYASVEQETTQCALAFQGSMRINATNGQRTEVLGSGHHGPDYNGVAMLRAGKGTRPITQAPQAMRIVG